MEHVVGESYSSKKKGWRPTPQGCAMWFIPLLPTFGGKLGK